MIEKKSLFGGAEALKLNANCLGVAHISFFPQYTLPPQSQRNNRSL